MHYYFKLVGTLIFLNLINSAVLAADCTTIADNTWDCGIPVPSDNLIVNHTVKITAVFNATGTITINSGGHLTLTQNISIDGCIITVQPGGTLIIQGKAVFGSNSSIANQGTLSFSNDFILGNSASLISGGNVTVSGKVLIEQGSTLIIETGSTFHAYNDLELNSNDITINGLIEVEGSFTNNKSVTGTGQINYINNCDGSGTINGISSNDYCGSKSVNLTSVSCETDTDDPVISNIPAGVTLYATVDACEIVANWINPSATDNCSLKSLTSSVNSGVLFQVGTTTVTYTAIDEAGNDVNASFDITVKDTISPVINNIPENITQDADANSCGALVDWPLPIATDNCSLRSLTSSHNPGEFFSVGTTTVTYTAVDEAENEVSASFDITVKDTISPTINNIPEIIIQYADAGSCGAIVNWTLPDATDNCSVSLSSSHNPGDFFDAGITNVIYTALDIHGNSTSLTFEIKVKYNNEQMVHLAFSDTTIVIGESIQLFVEGGVRYRWEPVDFLDNPEIQDPIAYPTEDITYTIFMRTESGCIVRDHVMIKVNEEHSYYIPEMFTPDGDGVNDILFVNTLGYSSVDFKLFNRFGQLVFSTDDTNVGWDGRFNGNIQNPDTYVYTLVLETFTNQLINKKGLLQLVR